MAEINLFGKEQDYPIFPNEDLEITKRIKILVDDDFEQCRHNFDWDRSQFNQFIDSQLEHLLKIYKSCGNEDEFLETYAYKGD